MLVVNNVSLNKYIKDYYKNILNLRNELFNIMENTYFIVICMQFFFLFHRHFFLLLPNDRVSVIHEELGSSQHGR